MNRWIRFPMIAALSSVVLLAGAPAFAHDRHDSHRYDYRGDQRQIAREYKDLRRQQEQLARAYAWRDRALWHGDYYGASRAERRIRKEWRDVHEARRDLNDARRDAWRDNHWRRPPTWSR